jgi:hypothetical protein
VRGRSAFLKRANCGLGPDERRRFSVVRGDGSANRHGPAFHLDQTWQIRTFPTACLQAISEIEPRRQHPQDKDTAQMGFCPAPAIPPLHRSDVGIHLSRSTACGKCRVLPELAFGSPGARSPADCRTAQTFIAAPSRPKSATFSRAPGSGTPRFGQRDLSRGNFSSAEIRLKSKKSMRSRSGWASGDAAATLAA